MIHLSHSAATPCPGYPADVMFPDVEPAELIREAASEYECGGEAGVMPWQAYLQRVLPALERDQPAEMAQALQQNCDSPGTGRRHANTMRRRSIAAGNVGRARFWDNVLQALSERV